MKEFWNQVSPDAIITTVGGMVGSFFGAFLAGAFAILVLKKQIKNNEEREDKAKSEDFIKTYHEIISSLTLANECMKILLGHHGLLDENSLKQYSQEKRNAEYQKYTRHLNRYSGDLEKVNNKYIPLELIEDFLTAKRDISGFDILVNAIIKNENSEYVKNEVKKQQIKVQQRTEAFIKEFEKFAEKALEKIN